MAARDVRERTEGILGRGTKVPGPGTRRAAGAGPMVRTGATGALISLLTLAVACDDVENRKTYPASPSSGVGGAADVLLPAPDAGPSTDTGGAGGAGGEQGSAGDPGSFPGWCGFGPCPLGKGHGGQGGAMPSPYVRLADAVWLVRGVTDDGYAIYARSDGLYSVSVKGDEPSTMLAGPGADGVVSGRVTVVWHGSGTAPLDAWTIDGFVHLSDAAVADADHVAVNEEGTEAVFLDAIATPTWMRASLVSGAIAPLASADPTGRVARAAGRFVYSALGDTGPYLASIGAGEETSTIVCTGCGPVFFSGGASPWVAVDASAPGGGTSLAWVSGGKTSLVPGANVHSAGAAVAPDGSGFYYRTDAGDLAYTSSVSLATVVLAAGVAPTSIRAVSPDGSHAMVLIAGKLYLVARDVPGLVLLGEGATPANDPFTDDSAHALLLRPVQTAVQLFAASLNGSSNEVASAPVGFAVGKSRVLYEEDDTGILGIADLATGKKSPIIGGASPGPDRLAVTTKRDRAVYITGTQRLYTFLLP